MAAGNAGVTAVDVSAYTVPTETPEADGTLTWNETTLVLVRLCATGQSGFGYTFANLATAHLIDEHLKREIVTSGLDGVDISALWTRMLRTVRNLGSPGICSMAISAVDNALWDLKARLLGIAVADLLGRAHRDIAAYGSGGFTSYGEVELQRQLAGWVEQGIDSVKMKIGSDPARDLARVRAAWAAIGPDAALFVDANGAYGRKEALAKAHAFAELGVTWLEEPVPSDDLEGLRLIRDRAPAGMRIAAGEYGYDSFYFRRMLEAGAVDVLQADATRCAGVTGFLAAGHLAAAFSIPFSAHTAPSLHAHAACALPGAINVEYFFDHYRIEQMFFDGALVPRKGRLLPDAARPGFGLECKTADMEKFKVYGNSAA
jgi:L-alanine-DL-glutamate epimerase-like enolase superfamily enzyme